MTTCQLHLVATHQDGRVTWHSATSCNPYIAAGLDPDVNSFWFQEMVCYRLSNLDDIWFHGSYRSPQYIVGRELSYAETKDRLFGDQLSNFLTVRPNGPADKIVLHHSGRLIMIRLGAVILSPDNFVEVV